MIKPILLVVLFSIYLPNLCAKENPENFQKCASSDPSWMSRFGQYIVSTDLGQAYDICRQKAWPNTNITAVPAGCHFEGHWLRAGYYCQSR